MPHPYSNDLLTGVSNALKAIKYFHKSTIRSSKNAPAACITHTQPARAARNSDSETPSTQPEVALTFLLTISANAISIIIRNLLIGD